MNKIYNAMMVLGSGLLGMLIPIDALICLSSTKYPDPDYPLYAILLLLAFSGSYGYTKRFKNTLLITMYAICFWGSFVTFALGAILLSGTYRNERLSLFGKIVFSSMDAQFRIGLWFTIVGLILFLIMIITAFRFIIKTEKT